MCIYTRAVCNGWQTYIGHIGTYMGCRSKEGADTYIPHLPWSHASDLLVMFATSPGECDERTWEETVYFLLWLINLKYSIN
jgi:hypothetical protein